MVRFATKLFVMLSLAATIGFSVAASGLWERGYQLKSGWKSAESPKLNIVCDRAVLNTGYPLVTSRPDANDPSGCGDETNRLTAGLNGLIYLALPLVLVFGSDAIVQRRKGRA